MSSIIATTAANQKVVATLEELPVFTCPTCNVSHQYLHVKCQGEYLPVDKCVNLPCGLRGWLGEDWPLPAEALVRMAKQVRCEQCGGLFKGTHVKCREQVLPPELQIHGGVVGAKAVVKAKKAAAKSKKPVEKDNELPEDELPTVPCPYGCGTAVNLYHVRCKGKMLSLDKRIDLRNGLRGALSPDHPLPTDVTWKMRKWNRCDRCGKLWWKEHNKCYNPVDYVAPSKTDRAWFYWVGELTLRSDTGDQTFPTMAALVKHVLAHPNCRVAFHDDTWKAAFKAELAAAHPEVTMMDKIESHVSLKPAGIRLVDVKKYAMDNASDYPRMDKAVQAVTGICLESCWTLATLTYDYWEKLAKGEGHDIRLLQGEELQLSRTAYHGARSFCQPGEWVSSLLPAVEAGELTYEQLLADPTADIRVQVDINSMYPALMRGFSKQATYYPLGASRTSEDGEAEFRKGSVGLFKVRFTRPAGLPMAILPQHCKPGGERWPKEAGEGFGVYTEVDLGLAEQYGYQLQFEGPCVIWEQRGTPFTTWCDKLYPLKAQAEDEAKRWVAKHMLVTLHGKLGQDASGWHKTNNAPLSVAEAKRCLREGVLIDYRDGKFYLMNGQRKEGEASTKVTKPNHLGTWLMSWTRVLMTRLFELVDWQVEYCHTDCLRVTAAGYHKLLKAGWIDQNELGLLKVENGIMLQCTQNSSTDYSFTALTKEGRLENKGKGRVSGKLHRAAQE